MEVVDFSQTLANTHQTTRHHIPQDSHLHNSATPGSNLQHHNTNKMSFIVLEMVHACSSHHLFILCILCKVHRYTKCTLPCLQYCSLFSSESFPVNIIFLSVSSTDLIHFTLFQDTSFTYKKKFHVLSPRANYTNQ
jgi:hypothetical protein